MKRLLVCLLLVLLAVGCGKNTQRVEIARWKKGGHLETPLGFAMFMSQEIDGNPLADLDGFWTSGIIDIVRFSAETGNIEDPLAVIPILKGGNDKVACLSLIAAAVTKQRRFEKLEEIVELAQSIESESLRIEALKGIAAAIAGVGELPHALKVANAITDDYYKTEALIRISEALIAAGEEELALIALEQGPQVVQRIPANIGLEKEQSRFALSLALCKAGGVEQALLLAEEVRDPSDKARVLTAIARNLFESGDRQQALTVLKRSLELAGQENGDFMKSIILPDIAFLFADLGDFGQALAVAAKLDDPGTKFEILARKAAALAEMGELEEALKEARAIQEPGDALGRVAVALARKDDVPKALEVANTIENEYHRGRALVGIAEAQIEAGHVEQALEVLDRLAASDPPFEAGFLVSSLARSEKLGIALEVASRLKDSSQKVLALVEIAVAQFQAANIEESLQILQQALDTAGKLDASHLTPIARLKISSAQLLVGQREEALASASQAVEAGGNHYNKGSILLDATFLRAMAGGKTGSLEVLKQALDQSRSNPDAKKRRNTVAFLGIALATEFDPNQTQSPGDQALSEGILSNVAVPLRIKKTFNAAEQGFARELLEAFQAE
jgi:tetratricopeptide (TPR) repeat protein